MQRVVLEGPRVLRVTEAAPALAEQGEALIRLRTAGICGSDLAAYRGTSPLVTYPRVLGHELLVDVLKCESCPELEGRRAVVDPMVPCGTCAACRTGRYNCCARLQVMGVHVDGGLQELSSIDPRLLHPVPDDMPDELAVLAEPLTIAYHAVRRSEIRAGETCVVLGAGTIGLLIAILLVRARGCRVMVVDVDERRLGIARSVGATVVHGDESAVTANVQEQTAGDMAAVVFEASGNAAATRMSTALVAHAGRIVLIGWNRGPVEVDTVTLMRKEVDLLGSRNSVNAFPPVLRLLQDGVVDPNVLVSHRYQLVEAASALDMLDKAQQPALKVLIEAR